MRASFLGLFFMLMALSACGTGQVDVDQNEAISPEVQKNSADLEPDEERPGVVSSTTTQILPPPILKLAPVKGPKVELTPEIEYQVTPNGNRAEWKEEPENNEEEYIAVHEIRVEISN